MFGSRTEVQQWSLRGLRVPIRPSRVTDQPRGRESHEIFNLKYEINDN